MKRSSVRSSPSVPLARLTRPESGNALPRSRLFELLDGLRRHRVTWVASPAGSGKTTLLSSYIAERGLSCLWYQADDSASDPATFFHHLALAARALRKKGARPLPHQGTEYASDLEAFAGRFFEALFASLPPETVVVFDDAQAFTGEGPPLALLLAAVQRVPDTVRLIVLSRAQPPAALSRQRANRWLEVLEWEQLRFDLEESRRVLELLAGRPLTDEHARRLHELTAGWAVGLVLLASDGGAAATPEPSDALPSPLLFDYFATEFFGALDERTRGFLLATSVVPRLTPRVAEALGEERGVQALLERLCREHLFTERRRGKTLSYEYHPLFRRFLLDRAAAELGDEALARLRGRAAAILESEGETEAAASLWLSAGDPQALVRFIHREARTLERTRRWETLETWLRAVPEPLLAEDPWLAYWLGLSVLPRDTVEARRRFESAFAGFLERKERTGAFLAWARVVESIVLESGSFQALDHWLDALEKLRRKLLFAPSVEAFARVNVTLLDALLHRRPDDPRLPHLVRRLRRLLGLSSDVNARVILGTYLLRHDRWTGDLGAARAVIARLRPMIDGPEVEPIVRVVWAAMESAFAWFLGSPAEGLAKAHEALAVGERLGIHFLDFRILTQGAYCALSLGRLDEARAFVEAMPATFRPERRLDMGQHVWVLAWLELAQGRVAAGLALMEEAISIARGIGAPYVETRAWHGLAFAQLRAGRPAEARASIQEMRRLAEAGRFLPVLYVGGLTAAEIAIADGDEEEAKELLAEALGLGRRHGYASAVYWSPQQLAALCARALEWGIEPELARTIIDCHGLQPHAPADAVRWPWPVALRVMGASELLANGALLEGGQGKPFELLKVLVALGGERVPLQTLTEHLWPDADGDRAHDALKTTLARLRKLVGHEAVLVADRRLSLDRRRVWVDAFALERLLDELLADRGDPRTLLRRASALYRGHLMDDELDASWALAPRVRLRERFVRALELGGRRLRAQGHLRECLLHFQRGLELEPLSEELHLGLMELHAALGHPAEAFAAYERCRMALDRGLGVAPSEKLRALADRLRASLA